MTLSGVAAAKPTKDEQAAKIEQKALRTYVAGDLPGAVKQLEHALKLCESGCSSKTKSHLHVSLGTVRGVGEGDYGAAKKEFVVALSLDPEARLRTLTTPALTTAFEEAKNAIATAKPVEKPPEKPSEQPVEKPPPEKKEPEKKEPDKPVSVSDLFHSEEKEPSSTTKKVEATVLPPIPKPENEPRYNWLSVRGVFDFGFISDANICARDNPPSYYCTDLRNAPYRNFPQPNDAVSPGFAFSTARLLLGYERLLFGGFTAGAFLGLGVNFAPTATDRPEGSASPFSFEVRGTYTFGDQPFVDNAPDKFHPFVFGALGVQELDTHVIIRVNEIPCQTRVGPACKQDLNAFRLSTGVFGSLGGGLRYKLDGRHALRAAVRGTFMFGDSAIVVSPEIAYEFGI